MAKIRFIIHNLSGGGAERVCVSLANLYAARGIAVELVLAEQIGAFLEDVDSRVKIISLNVRRARAAIPGLWSLFKAEPKTVNLIFGFELGVSASIARALAPNGGPVVYREGNSPFKNIPATRRWLYGTVMRSCDGVIVQSHAAGSELDKLGLSGLPRLIADNPAQLKEASTPYARTSAYPTVLSVGRLNFQKGFDRLLRAFAHLHRSRPGSRLIVLGEGPMLNALKVITQEQGLIEAVEWAGFRRDVASYVDTSDVFVLSSYYEGQPNVLVEAILRRRPVLAAGGPAVAEMLERVGLSSCYLENDDFGPAFVCRIENVLALPNAHWAEAASRLSELCDPNKVADRYLQFLSAFVPAQKAI